MAGVEVRGKIAARPSRRIAAIKAKGIAIMAINVDRALTRSGGIMASSPSIVAYEWHDDSGLTSMILNVLHVGTVREVIIAAASAGVLVLGLIQNDWAAISDLCLCNGCSNVGGVAKNTC